MVWQSVKEMLREELSESVFNLWIEPIECSSEQEDTVKLRCPDRFFSAYVSRNYRELILQKFKEVKPQFSNVVLSDGHEKVQRTRVRQQAKQLRLPLMPEGGSCVRSLHPRYTFDEFMVGESNILAQSACKSVSLADDSIGPCVYINSSTGLGKSHLTHAVAHHLLANSPMTRLHYLTAQQFSLEMVNSIKSNSMGDFKRKYHNNCDVLLVEDIHTLTGKKKTQEELNELLDSLIKSGKRIIVTSNRSPRDLVGIDEEFRSRMTAGLVTSIQAPDLSTRIRIVGKKALQYNLSLNEEHVDYLAQHIKGDVRQLESALVSIRAKAQLRENRVDLRLLEQIVSSMIGGQRDLSPSLILEFISRQFDVTAKDLKSRSRKRVITFPRQIAMYLCRKHTDCSLADIGREFNRDHSTVLHAIKVVTGKTHKNTSVDEQVRLLSTKLSNM